MAKCLADGLESRQKARVRAIYPALLLAGCASGLTGFKSGMDGLIGQPSSVALQRLGYPERQEVIAGRTVYYYGTDHEQGPSCAFKVITYNGMVEAWDGLGNAAGCSMYVRALRR